MNTKIEGQLKADAKTDAKADAKTAPAAKPAANAAAAQGDDEPKLKKDIVPEKYRDVYAANKGTCGDFIAGELSAIMETNGATSLNQLKRENGVPEAKWTGLNNGQQRMNISNAIRANYLQGQEVNMMGKKFSLDTHMEEFGPKDFEGSNESHVKKFLTFVGMPENARNMRAVKKYFFDGPQKALDKVKREEAAAAKKAEKAAEKETAAKAKADAAAEKAKADAAAEKAKTEAAKAKTDAK